MQQNEHRLSLSVQSSRVLLRPHSAKQFYSLHDARSVTTNECFGPLCSLWSNYPECNFVQRLLLSSVLPRCACWELPVCCWAAPDCFFSRHEARRPYWPVHRPVPATSWVATHPGTLWTERTAHWLNKQRKTYSSFKMKMQNTSFPARVPSGAVSALRLRSHLTR